MPPFRRRPCWQLLAPVCAIGALVCAATAGATDYYVANGGADSNDGSAPQRAFASVARGVAAIRNPGDRVVVAPGVYAEGDLRPPRGGTGAAPVELIGDSEGILTGAVAGEVAIEPPAGRATGFLIAGLANVVVEGFTIRGAADAAIQVRGTSAGGVSRGIALRRNVALSGAKRGIDVVAAGEVRIVRNRVVSNGSAGLSVVADARAQEELRPLIAGNILVDNGLASPGPGIFVDGTADAVVQSNQVSGSGTGGIALRHATDPLIANNLVVGSGAACGAAGGCGDGLALGGGGAAVVGAQVVNNTLYDNDGWGLVLGGEGAPSTDAVVINNIAAANSLGGIAVSRESTCGYVAGFNLNRDGYGPGTPVNVFDLNADPRFVDAANGDFLLRSDSPAVDAGSTATAAIGLGGSALGSRIGDPGAIDLGYHAGAEAEQRLAVPLPYMPIFVRPGGDDAADGRTPETALATPSASDPFARAGVTVVVAPGRYVDELIGPGENRGRVAYYADTDGTATGDAPGPVVIEAPDAEQSRAFVLLDTCGAVVDGFTVAGGFAGIQVRGGSHGSQVRHNVVFGARRRAVDVAGARGAAVFDNLLYANGGGVQIDDAAATRVTNNTIYGNENIGVLVRQASPCAYVAWNIFDGNAATGLRVEAEAAPAIVGANVNTDGYFGVERPNDDFDAPPQFVAPAGADRVLGGAGFADDAFQVRDASPAVDIASIGAAAARLDDRSTRLDGTPDSGALDAGYHYASGARDPRRALAREELEGVDVDDLCADAAATPTPRAGGGGGGGCAVTSAPGSVRWTIWLALLSPLIPYVRRSRYAPGSEPAMAIAPTQRS